MRCKQELNAMPSMSHEWPGPLERRLDHGAGGARGFFDARANALVAAPEADARADYMVVVPVLNQLDYTQRCVASLLDGGTDAGSILVIDNGSSDDTPRWLDSQHDVGLCSVRNRTNLGCGGAWTQGALLSDCQWVVLLNNDVVMCRDGISALLDAADRQGLDVISPSIVEGELDYDFDAFAAQFRRAMNGQLRRGWFHGVCFAVRRRVFETIGFPDTDRQLGGREDVEYLVRCDRHGVPTGTVGDVVLHHFGSVTQQALKQQLGLTDLGDRHHFYRKLGMGWLDRKRFKHARREQARRWAARERACGYSMHMLRHDKTWSHAEYL
jgi:glycosyltransferase involved in cell wall biosynthesis